MTIDNRPFNILVVEDNPGDFLIIEECLLEKFTSPIILHAGRFNDAVQVLADNSRRIDVILLDLSLPDKTGLPLITAITAFCSDIPIIILTGYADFEFSVRSVGLGIADYLLKEELTPLTLYKSIIYSAERIGAACNLRMSEKRYSDLFNLSPLPMWVADLDTLQFLDVNEATIAHYGYSREEFLAMTLRDIRAAEDVPLLYADVEEVRRTAGLRGNNIMNHRLKNGAMRKVEVKISPLQYNGRNATMVIATDVTENLNYLHAIQQQNERLKEIAWLQSHIVRAPLARLMGLVQIAKDMDKEEFTREEILSGILSSAGEVDTVIRDINNKTDAVSF